MLWDSLVKPISEIANKIIDKIAPDADMADKLKAAFSSELLNFDKALFNKQADIIIAEAQSDSWITRSWRPITMLVFVGLITLHWLGFTPDSLSEEEVLSLLDIIKVGLGGYVLSRGGEKIMKEYKK